MGKINRLTARQCETAKAGSHSDGGNLYLRVRQSGSRSWVFRFTEAGRPVELGLGALPLASARQIASDMRKAIAEGMNPRHIIKPPEEAPKQKFRDVAADHIAAKSPAWRNKKHAWQWTRTMEQYVFPVIGDLTPDNVTVDHILRILTPIWSTRTETATRVRQRIEAIMDRAITLKLRPRGEGNPAEWSGHLDNLLPSPKKIQAVAHHAAIAHTDLRALLSQLRMVESVGSYCLQFITLTAVRSGEARGATWDEFDLLAGTWTIPAERMKAGKPHIVPLSAPALAILEAMKAVDTHHVFASPMKPRQPISDIAVIKTLHRIKSDITVHGMRSAFRDWCSERTSFTNEVVESSLAHSIRNKTEAAYFRSDLLEKRRALMDTWANYLVPQRGNVIALAAS